MELRHLRYFVAAAEAENVSRAALKLHVSQPALSRQIRDLEDELGFSLFERSAKSVRLTEAGRAFLIEAKSVLERAEGAVRAARAVANQAAAELHIGYAPSPTVRLAPGVLKAFQSAFPKVRIKLHDLSTQEMLEAVRDGSLQLAFMVKPSRALLRGVHFEELFRDHMCVATPPDHPWARLPKVSFGELQKIALLGFTRSEYPDYHDYLEQLFAGAKLKPHFAEEYDSASTLIAGIESGAGLAVMPESFTCTAGPRLKLVPLTPAPPPLIIGAVWTAPVRNKLVLELLKCAREVGKRLGLKAEEQDQDKDQE